MLNAPDTTTPTIADILHQAMQDHGAGRSDAAQALYQRVLDDNPGHPDALHLLGLLHAQRGQHERAAELIARAIDAHPTEAMFHNNLGNVCIERSRYDEAEACYMRAIELAPDRIDALNNLGVLLSQRGGGEGAEKVLLKVVELAPDFVDARQNLVNHYLRAGRIPDAIQQCFDGLIVAPRSGSLRRMLGVAYSTMGMTAEATAVYRAWLQAEPDNPVAAYHLSACTGEDLPERAPDAYVSRIFDAFAKTFDAKLADLSYKAPELAVAALAQRLAAPAKALDVLDAGCGTGLCGPLLTPYARTLVGVDLSAGMLGKARARGVYDELVCGELMAFLASRPAAFDLVVSTDTLIYFGRLDAVMAATAAAVRPGGWLFFTLEAHGDDADAPDFRLHEHGRYSHRRRYVEAALRHAGFDGSDIEPVVLRMEAGEPVDGWLVSARAAPPI